MKSNLLLLIGLPLVFAAVLFAFETKQPLWLFLAVPVWIARWFVKRELKKSEFVILRAPDRPDMLDIRNIAGQDDNARNESIVLERKR